MSTTIVLALCTYAFVVVCWVLYLAVMNLSAHKHELGPVAKAHAYVLLAVGYPFDFVLNMVIGTVLFLDLPQFKRVPGKWGPRGDWMMTDRLKRYHRERPGTWRDAVATWICAHLLDPFAPGGRHC